MPFQTIFLNATLKLTPAMTYNLNTYISTMLQKNNVNMYYLRIMADNLTDTTDFQ